MFPAIFRVRQNFTAPRVENIPAEVHAQLARLGLDKLIQPGDTVALTAGSRGIAHIALILKTAVEHLQRLGAKPFLVPAMGSHGGGTAAGQLKVLREFNITEEYCGCEIRASMETVIVCQAAEGFPVHFDQHAYAAEHVLVVGRIKPHTNFTGDIQSGLLKMLLIGLGKHEGAKIYHRAIMDYTFGQIVRSVAREVLAKCRIIGGLAIIENGYDETAHLEAVPPAAFETREAELLQVAAKLMPRLPFERADILIVDEIGKEISGSGMDTNVIGRKYTDHMAGENEFPKIKRVIVRDLSEKTNGNATGLGMAEFCRTRAIEKMNVNVTRINCLTGLHPTAAMLPLDYATDREILAAALPTIGLPEPPQARLLWIRNTLEVAEVECAGIYYDEARRRSDLEILCPPRPLPLDAAGNLPAFQEAFKRYRRA